MERVRKNPSVQIEIVGGVVRVNIPDGSTQVLRIPKKAPMSISELELKALTVMQLAIPLAFPEETTGVDQAGYRVRREEDVHSLPGGREGDYREALTWAGAILQGKGRDAEWTASLLMSELPDTVRAGVLLGSIKQDSWDFQKAILRRTIANLYPGGAYARKIAKQRPVGDW